jgi:hypothetical protein
MTPFLPATLPAAALDVEASIAKFGLTREEAEVVVDRLARQRQFLNDRYQVAVTSIGDAFSIGCEVLHLSIKRRDKEPMHDWRDLQQIKNMLVGPECEGMELYPAESRLVDGANQYHLFVFAKPGMRFPLGFQERLVSGPDAASSIGAKQRGFS